MYMVQLELLEEYIDAERPVVLNKSTLSAPASTNNVTRQARPAGSPGPPRMDLDRKDGIAEDEDDSTLNLERDDSYRHCLYSSHSEEVPDSCRDARPHGSLEEPSSRRRIF